MTSLLTLHPGLARTSRLSHLTHPRDAVSARDWIVLIGAGVAAALCSTLIDLHLRIPGHSILKVVFPVAVGIAIVPRQGAGTTIGFAAILTAMSLRMAGFGGNGLGTGALTSLTVIGPALDMILRKTQSSRGIYLGFICAGVMTNLTALAVRGSFKWLGIERAGGRPLFTWLSQASMTYLACGVIAGLVSALILFSLQSSPAERENV